MQQGAALRTQRCEGLSNSNSGVVTPVCLLEGDTGCVPSIAEDQVGEVSSSQVIVCPGVTLRHLGFIVRKRRCLGGFQV